MAGIEDLSFNISPVYGQKGLRSHPDIQTALGHMEVNYNRFFKKQIEIAREHAPTFNEKARGKFMAKELERAGLEDIHTDEAGNVIGGRPGKSGRTLAISAHLDTVFPEGLKVEIKKHGERWTGPDEKLTIIKNDIGYRPGGETHPGHPLVKAAQWATKSVDMEPKLEFGSTDSNIPISMGIPAITIGGGGRAGNLHTENEWYDNTDAFIGLQRILLLVMAYDCAGQ